VEVAVDLTYQQDLLAVYRRELWMVLAVGLLLSIAVGYRIAQRGLQPLRDIANAIGRTRSTTLDERVPLAGLPYELRQVASSFNEMLDRLGDSFSRLSRFSSDIAHELRTPLNNLLGEIEVSLTRTRSAEEYAELLGSLSEECQQLSRLIDSLLFLARAEHPDIQVNYDDVDVIHELNVVREFYEAAATESGVRLELSGDGSVHARLDRTLLQRAVGNLVQNALAHTPSGGDVALAACTDGRGLVISVTDSGVGISPAHLNRVFDRFYRVDPARSKHTGGVGLGLAIVQSIAKLHDGRIELESVPGSGTRASLIFPSIT
jgi:two-component system heavy metal sensor histidine kinase CusS